MLVIFRKDSEVKYAPRAKGSIVADLLATLASMVRVTRPGLVEFFAPTPRGRSSFAKLTPITTDERHNVALYGKGEPCDEKAAKATIKAKGFTVPKDSLGRTGRTDHKTGESIRLWIKTRLAVAGEANGVTIADPAGSDLAIVPVER